jgi:type 1 glutamine amidotransferase
MVHRIALLLLSGLPACAAQAADSAKPLRALLVTGGCCHNYKFQSQALTNGVAGHARVDWRIVHEGGAGTHAEIALYDEPHWAKGFDVVVHNECFADTKATNYIRRITEAHRAGTPAVVIHCAMHTYRAAAFDDWREFLGVTSRRHDHQSRYPVKKVAEHPILQAMPADWVTPKDELYIIDKVWPNAKALATSVSERDGKEHAVFWVNQFGKARVFGTTYGHSDDTFRDVVFLDTVSRGLLWAAGRLKE